MSKDIHGYFHSFSKCSAPSIAKISLTVRTLMKNLLLKSHVTVHLQLLAKSVTILKKWETDFEWLVYDEDLQDAFCKHCQKWAKASNKTGGKWVTKPFHNWKKAVTKMKEHSESESHRNA